MHFHLFKTLKNSSGGFMNYTIITKLKTDKPLPTDFATIVENRIHDYLKRGANVVDIEVKVFIEHRETT
jgi:hypothetical protein